MLSCANASSLLDQTEPSPLTINNKVFSHKKSDLQSKQMSHQPERLRKSIEINVCLVR